MNYPSPDFDPADYIQAPRGRRLRSSAVDAPPDTRSPGTRSPKRPATPDDADVPDPNSENGRGYTPQYGDRLGHPDLPNTLDNPDNPADVAPHPRQPHLGYTLAVLGIGIIVMLVVSVAVLGTGRALHLLPPLQHFNPGEWPIVSVVTEAFSYGITIAVIVPLFRRMWQRPFAHVLQVAWQTARNHIGKLLALGAVLSILAQLAESRMTLPKEMPIDAFFKTPADLWVVALFGIFIAPIAEELFFRGFLFRGLAIAFDWLRLPHTEQARDRWHDTGTLSRPAVIASGILTSILFAVMHAAQLGFAWNAVGVLIIVGGALTAVRVRFNSVAASSLVHMAYNGFIFAVVFVATDGFRHLDKLQHR